MLRALESFGEVPKVSHEERGLTAIRQVKGKEEGRTDIRMSARGGVGNAFGAVRRYNNWQWSLLQGLDCVCIWTGPHGALQFIWAKNE